MKKTIMYDAEIIIQHELPAVINTQICTYTKCRGYTTSQLIQLLQSVDKCDEVIIINIRGVK